MNIKKSKKKAANCLAMTFLFLIAVVLMTPSITMAQDDRISNNREANLHQDYEVIPDTFTTDQPAEAGVGPQAMPAGGTFFNGTCYSSPLLIPAAAFSSDGAAEGSFYFTFAGGYAFGTGTYGCIKAPAYLPNGATVTSVYATVYDNNGTWDLDIHLRRVNRLSGTMDIMASLGTSGISTSIQQISDTSIAQPLIGYPDYAYYLTTCLDTSMRLYSVRIYFEKQ